MATSFKTLELKCSGCGRQVQVDAQLTGRKTSCPLCKEVIRVPSSGRAPAPEPARRTIQRDLSAESHLVALAIWQRITCMLGVVFVGWTLMSLSGLGAPAALVGAAVALPLAVSVACGALGFFLMKYSNVARMLTAALSAFGILATVLGGPSLASVIPLGFHTAVLAVLLSDRSAALCTPEYRERVARTPGESVPWARSPFFYIPALLLLIGVAFVAAGPLLLR